MSDPLDVPEIAPQGDGDPGGIINPPPRGGVQVPPSIINQALVDGSIGIPYTETFLAQNGQPPYTFSVYAGALPNGLVLSAGGIISGTPETAGLFTFVIRVEDVNTLVSNTTFTINIPAAPIITNSSLPNGTVGVPYNSPLTATGGSAPYAFVVLSGSLPPGLVLASTGGITGTPTAIGTFSFLAQITDSSAPAETSAASFAIQIVNTNLVNTVRTLDHVVLLGGADGALYAIEEGQRHDEDYDGNPVAYLQRWEGVPTPGGSMVENKLGGATIGAKGSGSINFSAFDDAGNIIPLTSDKRPLILDPNKESTRDFMVKGAAESVRFGLVIDNGGVVDAWFEAHVAMLWMRGYSPQRKG
jgi:hypothetical protein